MAAPLNASERKVVGGFASNLRNLIKSSKLFVVGAGGIGCELLKDLVLAGFADIHVVGNMLPTGRIAVLPTNPYYYMY